MIKRREKAAKQSVITSMATSTTQKPRRGIIKAKTEANLQYEKKMILGHQRKEAEDVKRAHEAFVKHRVVFEASEAASVNKMNKSAAHCNLSPLSATELDEPDLSSTWREKAAKP